MTDAKDITVIGFDGVEGGSSRKGKARSDDGLETTAYGSFSVSYRPEPYKETKNSLFSEVIRTGEGGPLDWSSLSAGEKARFVFQEWVLKFFPCKPFKTMTDAYAHQDKSFTSTFKMDVIAGITVGIMVIPQSMAYAMIAGLPGEYGLYSSFVPLITYAATGSSRQLAVGPVAIISLLTKASLSYVDKDSPEYTSTYIAAAITLAFFSGLTQMVLGCLRLGFVVNLMSHCVISGFTSAAAVLIGMSQLKHVFGFKIEHTETIQGTVKDIVKGIDKGLFKVEAFVMSIILLGSLTVMKKLSRRYKKLKILRALAPLIVTVFTIALVYVTRIDKSMDIDVVGTIPEGMPPLSTEKIDFSQAGTLFPKSITIGLLGFVESIAIAESIATKNGYELSVNQELFGVGLANMVGSCFSSYAVTGSFSRSAVNNDSGAKSTIASVVTATMVLLALLLLSGPLYFLPKCTLAAIVISSVINLFDVEEMKFLYKTHGRDLFLWFAALVGTLVLGVELGIAVSVAASLAVIIYEIAQPHTAVLGQIPGTFVYRSIRQYPEARVHDHINILRIDAPLYFPNVAFVKDKVRRVCLGVSDNVEVMPEEKRLNPPKFVIIEMGPVLNCDSSGAHALKNIVEGCKKNDVQICLSNPNGNVLRVLEKAGVINAMGRDWLFLRVHEAVQACLLSMVEDDQDTGDGEEKLMRRKMSKDIV
ncbi:sulfate permease [Chloropicon primus]|uniref:Sulfate permease n=1 Tax=Chloropicon primus TaxID=1764295 RepID=A0A5B8MWK3_9CHLO|nr:sulfate permease [Chloropicon primus]|eukprot:QDZ24035.1 sulfate permease [Chloropicon primus]